MAVYVISDLHLGHTNCLKFRTEFRDIQEHDEFITENILKTCGKRDSLYILGDVCLDVSSFHYVETIAERVEFLHIVLGNHDLERKNTPTIEDYIGICKGVYGMRKYKGTWLTHAPMHPSELRGKINIHGHIHDAVIDDDRYFNASCENVDYKPVNIVDILRPTDQ